MPFSLAESRLWLGRLLLGADGVYVAQDLD